MMTMNPSLWETDSLGVKCHGVGEFNMVEHMFSKYFFLQTGMMRPSMLRSCVPFAGAKEAKCESSCDPAKKCLDAVGAMRRGLRGDG